MINDFGTTLLAGIPTQFLSAAANKSTPIPGRRPQPLLRQQHENDSAPSWEGFESLQLCVHDWNFDFEGPLFTLPYEVVGAYLHELTLSVTCDDPAHYPIRATGYLYDKKSTFIGVIDLRYFGERLPRSLRFNLDAHQLPVSTLISIRFSVDGGGSSMIPRPPTITSVAMSLTLHGHF